MRRVPWLLLLSLTASAGPRHEYVAPSFLDQFDPRRRARTQIIGDAQLPEAVRRDGARLEAPGERPPGGRPSLNRTDRYDPDRRTVGPQQVGYHAVYNPSVAPWRRDAALDAVRDDATYQLHIAPTPRRPVPVGPRQLTPGYEPFWADITLTPQASGTPIPSVAPDMRVVALQVDPPARVRLERDAADNYYARVEGPAPAVLRLRLLVEVDAAYFGRPLPDNVPLEVLADHPQAELPPGAAEAGRAVLGQLGIGPERSFASGVARLVAWFRGFEERPFEGGTADVYRDLALGRVGVCRHRAFAFFITARAAGVPTRYIQNEAHAFVEVLAPDGLWRRIDLGGGAAQVDVEDGAGMRHHVPPADPFPQPKGAAASAGASPGMTVAGLGEPLQPPEAGGGSGAGAGAGPGSGPGRPSPVPLPRAVASAPPGGAPAGRTVRLVLEGAPQRAFRGDALPDAVQGRLSDGAGVPVQGRRVQLYLIPEGGGAPLAVGRPVRTDAGGAFRARVTVPRTAGPGRYQLVGASEEGDGWAAGRSDVR